MSRPPPVSSRARSPPSREGRARTRARWRAPSSGRRASWHAASCRTRSKSAARASPLPYSFAPPPCSLPPRALAFLQQRMSPFCRFSCDRHRRLPKEPLASRASRASRGRRARGEAARGRHALRHGSAAPARAVACAAEP
eukprot:scaffold30393_cov44-Phaeocystis_antarctica.AAC.1